MDGISIEDLRHILGEIVDALPSDEAEVVTALHWERLSLSDVAQRLGVKKSRVVSLRDRAYRRIRGLVEE